MLHAKPNLSKLRNVLLLPLLAMAAGCATQMPNVGAVVVPPKPKLSEVPTLVQKTEAKPAGFFQQELLNYSNGLPAKQTK